MEKFIVAGGVATRCSDIGKSDNTIVLIHGYLESLDVWDNFAGQLGKTHRIISIDLPGSGMSDWGNREVIDIDFMALVVHDVLASLSAPPATIVGHSMGGYVACAMAELFPNDVSRLVLFHSAPFADNDEKKAHRTREMELIANGKKELLASVNPGKGFAPQNVDRCAETIDELAEQIMLTDDNAIIATLRGMSIRKDRADFVADVAKTKPTLFILGANDNYMPTELQNNIAEKFPYAQIETLDKAGHMGFVEQQPQALAILSNFCSL